MEMTRQTLIHLIPWVQKARVVVLYLLLGIACAANVLAEGGGGPAPVLDYQVKAAMLYKFLNYTDWPETALPSDPSIPYRIWVLGSDTVADELQSLVVGRQVNGHTIQVYRASTPGQIENPHLVFIAQDMERFLPNLMSLARQESFLIVTENQTGIRPGSAINLRLIEGRIGFDISLITAQKYHLKLSSRLLAVAASVDEGKR